MSDQAKPNAFDGRRLVGQACLLPVVFVADRRRVIKIMDIVHNCSLGCWMDGDRKYSVFDPSGGLFNTRRHASMGGSHVNRVARCWCQDPPGDFPSRLSTHHRATHRTISRDFDREAHVTHQRDMQIQCQIRLIPG